MKRHGCARCGKFTMDLDEQRARLRILLARYAKSPTTRVHVLVTQATEKFQTAKKLHDEHMAQHAERR